MGPHGDAESVARQFERYALEALRWNWGEAYDIKVTDGAWQARRLDGLGAPLEADTPEGLRRAILDDYAMRRVPRA